MPNKWKKWKSMKKKKRVKELKAYLERVPIEYARNKMFFIISIFHFFSHLINLKMYILSKKYINKIFSFLNEKNKFFCQSKKTSMLHGIKIYIFHPQMLPSSFIHSCLYFIYFSYSPVIRYWHHIDISLVYTQQSRSI